MSIARQSEGSTESDPDYHNVEVQNFSAIVELQQGSANSQVQFRATDDVLGPDGMERDNLAELVAARWHHEVHLEDQGEATVTEPGDAQSRVACGINIDRSDSVLFIEDTDTMGNTQFIEGNAANSAIETRAADDPGLLWEDKLTTSVSFNDTVQGSGGAGTGGKHHEEVTDYRALFHTGPVVDATDDFVILNRIKHDSFTGETNSLMYGQLYWRPVQIEGARPKLGL